MRRLLTSSGAISRGRRQNHAHSLDLSHLGGLFQPPTLCSSSQTRQYFSRQDQLYQDRKDERFDRQLKAIEQRYRSPERSASARPQGDPGNEELHHVPIDASLFEAPTEAYKTSRAELAESETFEHHNPSIFMQQTLRDKQRFVRLSNLRRGYAALRQYQHLGIGLGKPIDEYFEAAHICFRVEKDTEQGMAWLRIAPICSKRRVLDKEAAVRRIGPILVSLRADYLPDAPEHLRDALLILMKKSWHANHELQKPISLAIQDLCKALPRGDSIVQFWDEIFQLPSINNSDQDYARLSLVLCYNFMIRHLARTGQYDLAVDLVESGQAGFRAGQWCPPIEILTARTLLQLLTQEKTEEATVLVQRTMSVLERIRKTFRFLAKRGQEYSASSERQALQRTPLVWSTGFINKLIIRSRNSVAEAQNDVVDSTVAIAKDAQSSSSEGHSWTPQERSEAAFEALEHGDLETAGRMIEQMVKSCPPKYLVDVPLDVKGYLPSAALIAAYQEKLLQLQPNTSAVPTEPPKSKEITEALRLSGFGSGLWQSGFVKLLADRGEYRAALLFFIKTFYATPLFCYPLFKEMQAARETSDDTDATDEYLDLPALKWPSTSLVALISKCLVEGGHQDILAAYDGENPRIVTERAKERLEQWFSVWKNTISGADDRGNIDRSRLSDGFFLPWLQKLPALYHHLMAIHPKAYQETHNAYNEIASLRIFSDLHGSARNADSREIGEQAGYFVPNASSGESGTGHELQLATAQSQQDWPVSIASIRSLNILQTMQDWQIQPDAATYTVVIRTLVRDDPDRTWLLVKHLAHKIGLTPDSPVDRLAGGPLSAKQALMAFRGLLGGLLRLAPGLGGPAKAREQMSELRLWLLKATRPSGSEDSMRDQERRYLLTAEQIQSDSVLMQLLSSSLEFEQAAREGREWSEDAESSSYEGAEGKQNYDEYETVPGDAKSGSAAWLEGRQGVQWDDKGPQTEGRDGSEAASMPRMQL